MPIIPSLRRKPDETDDLYREAWDQAGRIEADLHRPADPPVADRVSAMVQDLADRAGRLANELAPAPARLRVHRPSFPLHDPDNPDRR